MTDLGTELANAEIEEVESHLESSAPLLLELKSSPGSPKMNLLRIDMLEERPHPEKCQDDGRFTCIGKVIDTYRDKRTWQYGVAPATVLYVVLLFVLVGCFCSLLFLLCFVLCVCSDCLFCDDVWLG